MIPPVFHFVFGMAPDFGGRPFSLVHYLAVKSAVVLNRPDTVYFHFEYEPSGMWWDKAKPMLTLNPVKAPGHFMGKPLLHVAHKADVIRLQVLKETGGVYLDLDTISVKPLSGLFDNSFVIGQELKASFVPKNWRQELKYRLGWIRNKEKALAGLCNAVLLSEKNSSFVNRWLDAYSSFRSQGHDKYWNEHSVRVPMQLAALYPDELTQLGPYAFHYPLYDENGLRQLFEELHSFPQAYVHHLWESFSREKYISAITEQDILNRDTTYNLMARKFL